MAKKVRNIKKQLKLIDRDTAYELAEALELVKKTAKAKFDETVEVAVRLGVDPKKADQAN